MTPDRAPRADSRLEAAILRFWQVITFGRLNRLRPIEVVAFLTVYVTLMMVALSFGAAFIDRLLP
ncbi:hypothetical protein ACFOMD_16015 [Sphingoaurantiacus capsulatus]|uniref:ABC transporter permease n=1 Tax=Sphingoaurantiacus capsulatus TaxID=1771310 RepID=A0ABV7XFK7_9SPHN